MTCFFRALTLYSPWCSLRYGKVHDGGSMTGSAASTPPAASASLGDGSTHTVGSSHGSDNHTFARIEEIHGDACPAPAWLTPLADCCCKHLRYRAALQLRLLCCFRRRTAPPCSTSAPPDRAAIRCSPGGSFGVIASSSAAPAEQHQEEGWLPTACRAMLQPRCLRLRCRTA